LPVAVRVVGVDNFVDTGTIRDRLRCPDVPIRESTMTVATITEISATSDKSFEDAVRSGIARASKTLRNIKGAWVKDQEVMVENGQASSYKVILKVTFVLEE
jgi:flavin-binding protein dodecin